MRINEPLLREGLRHYLNSSDSAPLRATIGLSLLMGIALSIFIGCFGLLLVPTIIWTWEGLRMIWSAATLDIYRVDKGNERLKNPKMLKFLVAHVIIIERHGFSLAIGSFDPDQDRVFPILARLSREFAELYMQGPKTRSDLDMVQMLRDVSFQRDRRPRLVPMSHAGDLDLYLFDLALDLSGVYDAGCTTLVACIADERKNLVQVPWSYVAPAIEI